MAIRKPLSKKPVTAAPAAKSSRTVTKAKAAPAKATRGASMGAATALVKSTRCGTAAPAKAAAAAPVKKGAFGRPAAAPGTARKTTTKRAKPIKFVFRAPSEFKSTFIEVVLTTDKDGFIAPGTIVEAIKGKWDNENAPRYDLVMHDPEVAMTLVSRICMLTYVTNVGKRLPANKEYTILVRVSISKAKKNEIRAGIKTIWCENAKGKLVEMDKKDVECRRLRRCGKFLAASFVNAKDMNELKELEKEYQQSLDAAADDGDE
jgi:hypothetical protein